MASYPAQRVRSGQPRTFRRTCGLLAVAALLAACGSSEDGASGPAQNVDGDAGTDVQIDAALGGDDGFSSDDATMDDDGETADANGAQDTRTPDTTAPDAITIDTGGTDPDADDAGEGDDTAEPIDAGADTTPEPDTTDPGPAVDPWAPGPATIEAIEASISLGGGGIFGRSLDLDIYRPATDDGAPFPVVILNHGFQLQGAAYASYGERIASHGMIAVIPTYGGPLEQLRQTVRAQTDDHRVMLDWIETQATEPDSAWFGVLDTARIGAGGHSRGGKVSVLAAIEDDRIKATFNLDPVDSPPPFGGNATDYPSVTPELMGGLAIPSGWVGADRASESAGIGPACAPADDNYHEFYRRARAPTFEYLIANSGHLDFADDCGLLCATCVAGDDPEWNRNFSRATLVAFYRVFLADDDRYRSWVDGAAVSGLADRVAFASR